MNSSQTAPPKTRGSGRWARRPVSSREEFSLQALIELVDDVVGTRDVYKVAEMALMNIMGLARSPKAAIWAISDDHEAIPLRHFGFSCQGMRLVEEECLPVLRDDIDPEGAIPLVVSETEELLGPRLHQSLLQEQVEILSLFKIQGTPIALLALGVPHQGIYESFQLKSLETALCYVSAALENTRLHAQLTERNRRLRQMTERAGELDKLKTQFLDNLTHELRTPLAIITGCVDLARAYGEMPEETRETLDEAATAARSLDEMIMRLLEFRQAQVRQLPVSSHRRSLTKFLNDYHRDRGPGISGDLREMVLEPPTRDIVANVDCRRLAQVLDALVDNAVKFTPRGTCIELGLEQRTVDGSLFAAIRVSDNGPGIPRSLLEKIFESFRQVDGSMTRSVGGLGLGLSYAQEIMNMLGGTIELDSEVGTGTTCFVLVPMAESEGTR